MIPEKMKAVVVTGTRQTEVREFATPVPAEGEVLVRIDHCMICTWEQRIFTGGDVQPPFVPGHELSGTVAAIGIGTITNLRLGQPVAVKTFDTCGECEFCRRGYDNECTGKAKKRFYDGIPGSGGMAQYIAIASNRVFPIPGEPDLRLAAFTEPLACCLHSMEQADVAFSEDVVIVGGGIMGQLHNLLAKLRGARTILVEPDDERRALAQKAGANVVINPKDTDPVEKVKELTDGRGAHVVIFTVNVLPLAQIYLDALAKKGRIVYYGSFHPAGDVQMNPNKIHYSEKVITGSYSPTVKAFWTASRMLGYGLVDVRPFLSKVYPLSQCQEAFEQALSPLTYRVLVDLWEPGFASQSEI